MANRGNGGHEARPGGRSRGQGAGRQPRERRRAEGGERRQQGRHRQADDVEVVAVDTLDERRPDSLDSVGAGALAPLAAGDVARDVPGAERPKGDARDGVRGLGALRRAQVEAAVDLVTAAGEQAEVLPASCSPAALPSTRPPATTTVSTPRTSSLARSRVRTSTSSALPRALRSTVRTGSSSCRSSTCL